MAAKKLTADQKLQATARQLAGSQYDTAINASSKSIAQSQADRPEAARRIQGYFDGFKPLMDGGVDTASYQAAKQILASKDTAGPSASGSPSYSDQAKQIWGKYADNALVNRQQGMDAQRMALGQRARQDVQGADNRYANRILSSQNQLIDLQGKKSGAYTSQLVGLRATAENQKIAREKALRDAQVRREAIAAANTRAQNQLNMDNARLGESNRHNRALEGKPSGGLTAKQRADRQKAVDYLAASQIQGWVHRGKTPAEMRNLAARGYTPLDSQGNPQKTGGQNSVEVVKSFSNESTNAAIAQWFAQNSNKYKYDKKTDKYVAK